MAVTPIVTGDFQEYFYPMFDEGQETSSTSGVAIDAWNEISLLANSLYRLTVTGAFTGTTSTTMQLAFALSEEPLSFAIMCQIAHELGTISTQNLNTPGEFTGNIVPLTAAIVLPFQCVGEFMTGEEESTLTVGFRSMLALNNVEILAGSVLGLQCLRKPIP